jgi:hypothetical protein
MSVSLAAQPADLNRRPICIVDDDDGWLTQPLKLLREAFGFDVHIAADLCALNAACDKPTRRGVGLAVAAAWGQYHGSARDIS